jgi:hypothetical protein
MRTRAVAVASERSLAVGQVELECLPEALIVVYRGVGAFRKGYAPGALTTGTRIEVPWNSVREASFEGDRLFLQVDEAITPHHRLLLAGFSAGDPPDPSELRKQRLLLRIGTGVAMLVGGLLAAVTVTRISSDAGASAAVLLGCFGAGVVLFVGLVADHRLGLGGPTSEAARLGLALDLAARLPHLSIALEPALPRPMPPPLPLPSFQALLPRTTTAVVITMSAALLGAVLTAGWLARAPSRAAEEYRERAAPSREEPSPRERVATAAPAPAAPAMEAPSAAAGVGAPTSNLPTSGAAVLAGPCRCQRADSLLWRDGLPRLSTVLIDRRQKEHNGHLHLELELGVVNNWDKPFPEVSLLVQFYERDPPPSRKRTETFNRPLYFEGPLMPGQAIMWHVEARGNDFEVMIPPTPMLDPLGADAAATNLVADLLKAIHRPIRLHGAMMLAYLGDPRAKEGALGLREALREEEAPYIDRLLWTLGDVRTCAVAVSESGNVRTVHACVFNGTKESRTGLGLRLRALDRPFHYDTPVEAPPLVVAERTFKLTGQLPPGGGAAVTIAFDTTNPDAVVPQAFEAYADREELVF